MSKKEMLKEAAEQEARYDAFVTEIVESGKVWMLDDGEGVAVSTSNEFFDENGDETGVALFWSKEAEAKKVAIEDWSAYKAVAIDLDVFLEFSVITISNEDMLMGINWNPNMSGRELHPIEVAMEVIAELEEQGKDVAFKNHKDLEEYKEVTSGVYEEIFGE